MSVWHHLNKRQLLKENEFCCCGQIPPCVWRSARLVILRLKICPRGSWSDYSSENCWTVPSPEDQWCVTCEEGSCSTWISSSHILAAFEVFSNFPVCHKSQNQSYFQTWLKHSRNSQPAMSQFLSISRLLLRRPVHRFGLQPRFCSNVGGEQHLRRESSDHSSGRYRRHNCISLNLPARFWEICVQNSVPLLPSGASQCSRLLSHWDQSFAIWPRVRQCECLSTWHQQLHDFRTTTWHQRLNTRLGCHLELQRWCR